MKTLKQLEVKNQQVLLRTDYDVPLEDGAVADDTRIKASLPTITALLEGKAKAIIVLCHLDRPGGKVVESLRVKPVAKLVKRFLPRGAPVEIEENLRFNPGEKKNSLEFAKRLAVKGEVFVNDAFAVSHRAHASIISLPKFLPCAIGLHFEKELGALKKARTNPKRPLIFVIGGAKLETKLPIIEKLVEISDEVLVGGKLVQEIGGVCSPEAMSRITVAQLTADGKDITKVSADEFAKKISKAGTVVWNGPMGVYEEPSCAQGTRIIAQAVNQASGYTVIGGGDTGAAATKFAAEEGLDHISMGGGAMLQYLIDGTLVGLEAIKKSENNG